MEIKELKPVMARNSKLLARMRVMPACYVWPRDTGVAS